MDKYEYVIQIIRQEKDKYKFIKSKYSDGKNGRCTLGLLHSSMGWDGKDLSTRHSLRRLINNFGIHDITTIVEINDQCNSFEEVMEKLSNVKGMSSS
jgi:hypothetical protein